MAESLDPESVLKFRRVGMTSDSDAVSPRFVASGVRYYADQFVQLKSLKWRSEKTAQNYEMVLNLFSRFTDDRWPPSAVDILAWLNDVRRRGGKQATIDSYYGHLSSFLNFAATMNWLEDNPIMTIQDLDAEPEAPTSEPKSYYDAELVRLIGYLRKQIETGSRTVQIKARRDLAIVLLAYTTGARAGEIAALEISDIDLAACAVYIRVAVAKGKRKSRWAAFDEATARAVLAWLDEKPKGKSARIFLSVGGNRPQGRPLTGHALQQMLLRRCREAGVTYRNFHALRHSAGFAMVEAGISLPAVQAQLGHANLSTTQIYTQGRQDERLRAIRAANLSKRLLNNDEDSLD